MNDFLNSVDGILENFNDSEVQSEISGDAEKYKLVGALPYLLPFFFFVPIVVDSNSSYCKFHANQQLSWCIIFLAACVISMIFCLFLLFCLCGLYWIFCLWTKNCPGS